MEKLLKQYKYIIIVFLTLIVITIACTHYRNIKEVVQEKYESRQQLVEKNILQTIEYVNSAYQIVEQQLNQEMKKYSRIMLEKYDQNPEVMTWDLEEFKREFDDYEIYIVDSDLKIIRTTYQDDLGLDFSQYEGFATVLRERIQGDSFVVDRLDLSTQTGEMKKYSYMPTPDSQYLLELSVQIKDKYPVMEKLNLFKDATYLTEEYELVEEIAFFSVEPVNHRVAKLRSSKKPYLKADVSEIEDRLARQSVLTSDAQTEIVEKDYNYIYRFFPALLADESQEGGWNSYVVGITYNDRVLQQEVNQHRNLFIINIVIMLIVFALFIGIVIYLLRKFEHQAYHDPLTGLGDRELFEKRFAKIKKEAEKKKNNLGILFLDVDKFKAINDNYGHEMGDYVLEKIATRLQNNLKKKDILARMGGDEFIIALSEINSKKQLIDIAHRIIAEFEDPISFGQKRIMVSLSAGISIYPDDGSQLEELINKADKAMYQAKQKEKDLVVNSNWCEEENKER